MRRFLRPSLWFSIAAIVLSALLISWSWLAPAFYFSTWLGFALFFVLATRFSPKRAFFVGALIGGCALLLAFHWTPAMLAFGFHCSATVAWGIFFFLVVWEAIPFGLTALLAARQMGLGLHRIWIVPVAWVALESYWPKIFPWAMGHTQTEFLPLLQIAELTGAGGIGLCLIAVTLIPAAHLRRTTDRPEVLQALPAAGYTLASLALLAGALAWGYQRQQFWDSESLTRPSIQVAVVQVDPSYIDAHEKMQEYSRAWHQQVDLVCWPESSLGAYCLDLHDFLDEETTVRLSVPSFSPTQPFENAACELLAGGKSYPPGGWENGPIFQTAFLIRPDQAISGRYMKRTLLPIGEYMPGERYIPGLRRLTNRNGIVAEGNDARPLVLQNGARLGTLICYEDTVPQNARETVALGAQALVSLINASDFEHPLALEQHMRLSLLRAVENRRYFVRCAGTGVSCIIAPTGAILTRADANTEKTLVAEVRLIDQATAYGRFGYLFPPACLLLTFLFLGWDRWSARRQIQAR